jgi:hypothetical protein
MTKIIKNLNYSALNKPTLVALLSFLFTIVITKAYSQELPLKIQRTPQQKGELKNYHRCSTMEVMEEAIRKDPTLPEKWRAEGERQYQLYLQRQQQEITQRVGRTEAAPIIIPVVFHLVDAAATINSISDRDIIEQVEILNRDYAGNKLDQYTSVIPPEIAARVGRINIKFVLARRDPTGALTNGIERKANTTPDHVSIKSSSTGGLDAWDVTKYLNVWCGTFSGSDAGLLGISTFPYTTGQGPQGVVIGISTLPYAGNTARSYYPDYAEGATLSHEIGHYFYLYHTFGDNASCNNDDFKIQSGWPLPLGAGPEGDDSPLSKGTGSSNFVFGNPSMNYKDGCASETFGMMYGCFMNYFDDRAMFMFSDGMRKRVEGCINLYRPGLLTTDGATPPSAVTDAFMVNVSPRGLPERRSFVVNNTPFQAIVRNNGTGVLNSVIVNVAMDGGAAVPTTFPLTLTPGSDTTLNLAAITGAAGNHTFLVYTSAPNGTTDNFLYNDTLRSYINIHAGTATLPLSESFTSATFPPTGWLIANPNGDPVNSWTRDATSGFTAAGAAFFDNYNINQIGTLDDIITPAIDLGSAGGAVLTFRVANAVYDAVDVSTWDGLEVYVSGNGGKTYSLAYKKTGNQFTTVAASTDAFTATPSEPSKWREETIALTPYIIPGQKMIIKFRNTNAFGNNTYIDDIKINAISFNDAQISNIVSPANGSTTVCAPTTPVVTIKNLGSITLTSATINVQLNGVLIGSQAWTGSLVNGTSANVTLNTIPITPVIGSNILKIYTTLPNGIADEIAANDTAISIFIRTNGSNMPVVEGFESSTFPTAGWSITPATGSTWQRASAGSASSFSAKADFWNFVAGASFSLISPYINVAGEPTVVIKFDIAHKKFNNINDRLQVLVTNDCGITFTTVYDKTSGVTGCTNCLATTTQGSNLADGGFVPNAPDNWRTDTIVLTGAILSTGNIQVRFVATSANGDNLYIDNIDIDKQFQRDLTVSAINKPFNFECSNTVTPQVVISNPGIDNITSYEVVYTIDGGAQQVLAVNTVLNAGSSTTISLPVSPTFTPGIHTIKVFTRNPVSISGTGDQRLRNDTLSKTFTAKALSPALVVEDFESPSSFPSPGWSIFDPNSNVTWVRASPGFNSTNSAFIDNYNYDLRGQLDYIVSPPLNVAGADSIITTFDVAYKYYFDGSVSAFDSLAVTGSTDCGNNFTTVMFNSGGVQLAGAAGSSPQAYTNPATNDWRHLRASIGGAALANGSFVIGYRNKNGFGNNMFLDNINVSALFKRDLQVLSIDKPRGIECTTGFTPTVTVKNKGIETVTAFSIVYRVDNGTIQTTNITGVSLAREASMSVNLSPAVSGLTPGQHNILVYSINPVTISGTGDMITANDTLRKEFGIPSTVTPPVTEGFESSTFPPTGWTVVNPDAGITWAKATTGNNSTASVYINNYNYSSPGRIDELYSPQISYNGVDSISLSFDLAAATYSYPGSTSIPLDTLQVLVSRDCGNTFTSIYKKWGIELQTLNTPNEAQPLEFFPSSPSQWRTETIDISNFAPDGPIQIVFRNTNNYENNIFIDNVNFITKILPPRIKSEGFLVLPNPFQSQFNVWHYQQPSNLRYISVYNSMGQLVWTKQFNSSAQKTETVDLSGMPAGIYIVQLGYSDKKSSSRKVVKY